MAVYRINDVLRLKRQALQMTREELAEKIGEDFSVMTLYRIEKGEVAVKEKNFVRISKVFGETPERGYGSIKLDDVRYLNYKSDIGAHSAHGESEKLWEKYRVLKEHMDPEYVRNKQYLTRMEAYIKFINKEISAEEMEKELWRGLNLTIQIAKRDLIAQWPFNIAEYNILNGLCRMKQIQNKKEILDLFFQIKNNTELKYMESFYYTIWHGEILYKISDLIGNQGKHEEANSYSTQGMEESIEYGCIGMLPHQIYDISWNTEKLIEKGDLPETEKERCKELLIQAYYLSLADNDIKIAEFYKNKLKEKYNIIA